MSKSIICERVEQLRQWMRQQHLDAYIFPSTDPHCGEYVPDHWMTRQWISGFTGSAGTAVVTLEHAALWTDSRYFLAAAEQLEGTPFTLMKDRLPETPSIAEWLAEVLPAGAEVGLDGWVNCIQDTESLADELEGKGLLLQTAGDPAEELWTERPSIPLNPVEIQPLAYAGVEAKDKLQQVRQALAASGACAATITQLDEIAWLTNLRGTDVHCNPVAVSYMVVTEEDATLFIDSRKLTPQVQEYLTEQGIRQEEYTAITPYLENYQGQAMLMDPGTCNYELYETLSRHFSDIVKAKSVIAPLKAIKNEAEIAGYRNAMLRDGVAMVKFLKWLKPAVEAGGQTEITVDQKLTGLRAEQPLYRDISFDTIAGYGPHGAIVHYEATPETDVPLEPKGLLLLDSGAQYQDGTTDITRTIALGPLTDEEKKDYTLVLRGHIRLAMVKFPAGTSGTQLDVCARYAMWQEGLNYLHGTGHGVGSYLNVHEGPHQIRMNYMPAPLRSGMTVTNEPGIYKAGSHGVRTENTMLITHYMEGEYGEFLQLEPLTLCPIDKTPIVLEMMQSDEIQYLNQYHEKVYEELSPLLNEEDRLWLREATSPLTQN